jgi:ATP-binding cassette subfamily B protein
MGAAPARASGIEQALRREHEGLLVEWARTARAEHRLATAVIAAQSVLGLGAAFAVVLAHVHAGGSPASLLLLVYWVLAIPAAGQRLSEALRELPAIRNLTLRLLEPLGTPEDETDASADAPAGEGAAAITLAGVGVVAGGHPILVDVDLALAAGEHVAIVGRSGGGKSTLLGVLLGWVRPAAGRVVVDGAPLDAPSLRKHTVWIDPAVALWNDSVAANLAYGARDPDLGAVIEAAELEPMIARLPDGLAARVGEGGGLLSGGEGQRVRLGRGIARPRPRLVLLDEPFRGLDRAMRRRQLVAARARWSDATLLCVTHDLEETLDFARVLVVEGGRIVEDGSPHELAARAGSRYGALVAGEARARDAWSRWTHHTLAGGRIEERG